MTLGLESRVDTKTLEVPIPRWHSVVCGQIAPAYIKQGRFSAAEERYRTALSDCQKLMHDDRSSNEEILGFKGELEKFTYQLCLSILLRNIEAGKGFREQHEEAVESYEAILETIE